MYETFKIAGLLTVSLFLLPATGFAQDREEETTGDTGKPASQEVEITEDNYRQFMELKNARQQRNIMPEDAFKPTAGSQKIDKLPEDSQKHLRNQLREVIVQGDQWQPGDEGKQYPYVPSEAAKTNEALQKQEAAAWGELMDNYHRREADIYENSARSQAAMADEGSAGGGSNTGNGSAGDGSGQPGGQPQDSQQEQADQGSTADSYSSNAANDPNARGTAGTSQNAMEYLQQMTQQGANGNSGAPSSPQEGGQQGQGQGQSQQQAGQQAASQQAAAAQGASADPSKNTPDQGAAGTSQSAMEFLQGQTQANQGGTGPGENTSSPEGDSTQGDALEKAEQQANTGQDTNSDNALTSTSSDSEGESTTGASQNALEFLQQSEGTNDGTSDGSADTSMAGNDSEGDGEDSAQAGQQGGDEQQAQADSGDSPTPGSPESGDEANAESTSGVSQNALEFLEGEGIQPGQGENPAMPPTTSNQSGTLSIKDLMNARGVGGPGNAPPLEDPKDKTEPPPDKDGGGL